MLGQERPLCGRSNTAGFIQGTHMKDSTRRGKQRARKIGLSRGTIQLTFAQTAATSSHVFNLRDCSPTAVCYS
jgi:hypothetical protein